VTVGQLVLASAIMAFGAAVQAAVGFGANLVAAPMLLLISTRLVPGPISVAAFVLNLFMIRRERTDVDVRGVRLAVVGLVPGCVLGGVALALLPESRLGVCFAVLIIVAVAMSAAGFHLAPSAGNLLGAGLLSGFMGTVSSIGGPPIAMVYQRASGPTLRGTLARYFAIGGVISIVVLAAVGRLGRTELIAAAALLPGTVAGFACSKPLARHIDRRTARPAILALSTLAALSVLVRELL
jgi:uncharacterized membrane protein YfcA